MKASSPGQQLGSLPVGALLRQWRDFRGKSQLDMSLEAGISQRHISFVESGRSLPSRQVLLDLAEALGVPLRERNMLLTAAGYAPAYSEEPLDAPALTQLTAALGRMLQQNEPYPAVVMDRHWNVVLSNHASPRFFGRFIDMTARKGPRNLLHLMFDPQGMRPFVADWRDTARMLLARLYREALGGIIDVGLQRLIDELGRYPDVDSNWRMPRNNSPMPMIPLSFVKDGVRLSYFSLVATVGTPQAVVAEELRLECMMPADSKTEQRHLDFMAAR